MQSGFAVTEVALEVGQEWTKLRALGVRLANTERHTCALGFVGVVV